MNKIQEQFQHLMENYTPVNVIHYFDFMKDQPFENVLEHAKMIFTEPTKGPTFLKESIAENFIHVAPDVIKESVDQMKEYFKKATEADYENTAHLELLAEAIQETETLYLDYKDNECRYLHDAILESLELSRDQVELAGIALENFGTAVLEHEVLLENNIVKGASSLGVAIRRPFSSNKEEAIKKYLEKIEKDLAKLKEKKKKYESKSNKGKLAHNLLRRDNAYNINKGIEELTIAIKHQKDKLKEIQSKGSVKENIGMMAPDIIYEDVPVASNAKKKKELDFSIEFTKFFMSDSTEINLESFNNMIKHAYEYDALMEEEILTEGAINRGAKKAAIAGDNAARKVAGKMRTAGRESKRVATVAKKIPGHFDKLIDGTFGAIKRMDKNERRQRIIEGNFRTKLLKIVRNGILVGIGWAINPAVAAVALIASVGIDKRADYKVRKELVADLEQELRMTREKLKDAEAKQDTQKKYQLMRLENALQRDIQRIQYNLKDYRATGKGVK